MRLERFRPVTLAALGLLASVGSVSAQSVVAPCVTIPGTITDSCAKVTATNPLPVTGSISASTAAEASASLPSLSPGTSPVYESLSGGLYVQSVFGTTIVDLTHGLPTQPQTGSTWAVTQSTSPWVVSGTVAATQSGTWTVQPGNTANTTPWLVSPIPSSSATSGVSPAATQAAASNSVLKGSAGIIRDLTITIGATAGWVMLFDATALPSNGATGASMVWCYPINSDGTKGGVDKHWDPPLVMSTGITVGFSSTACNSLTASSTAFFYAQVQ